MNDSKFFIMAAWTGDTDVVVDFDPLEFGGDDPTEVVRYYRVKQFVGGVSTRESETFVHEWQAHELATVWHRQRTHALDAWIDVVRVEGGKETPVARYGAPDETVT